VTKGTGPGFSAVYNPATNWVVGRSYDANGNELVSTYWTYNHENRVVATGNETYEYDVEGKRILRSWLEGEAQEEKSELTFWGIDGRRMGTYRYVAELQQWQMVGESLYFAGRLVRANGAAVVVDRLGSVVSGGRKYLPYGEERAPTANGQDNFATYYRDLNGLDYAEQRYYSSQMGRFLTPDPYVATTKSVNNPADPQSWNRYAYVLGDPINFHDPTGRLSETPPPSWYWPIPERDDPRPEMSPDYPAAYGPPAPTLRQYAESLAQGVSVLAFSDCQALANFADYAAYSNTGAPTYGFVDAFGMFVDGDDQSVNRAREIGYPIAGVERPVILLPQGSPSRSGYQVQFQETLSLLHPDQGHHFAAYFQAGYWAGAVLATGAALLSDLMNPGDLFLAVEAARLGADVRSGNIAPSAVGDEIRKRVCDRNWKP
jgi:RHS repeat-associated protein